MKIANIGFPLRAAKALANKGIITTEVLIEYISAHPGWCHSDAYPSIIRGIGSGTAVKILDGLLDRGLVDNEWHKRQMFLTTPEGYDSLFIHIARNRKKPSMNL